MRGALIPSVLSPVTAVSKRLEFRFSINLHRDSPDFSGNDVPLHISFRFDEGKVVFNSFTKGEWGKEERQKNPLKKGAPFDIRIRAHDNKFTIYADRVSRRVFAFQIIANKRTAEMIPVAEKKKKEKAFRRRSRSSSTESPSIPSRTFPSTETSSCRRSNGVASTT